VFYLPLHEFRLHGVHLDPSVVLRDGIIVPRAARRMCHTRSHLNHHVLPTDENPQDATSWLSYVIDGSCGCSGTLAAGTSGGLPTKASSPGGPISVRGSIDAPCSCSALATRVFTWSSRSESQSLPCFLYMCQSSWNPCF
jgi:hypothetical protein